MTTNLTELLTELASARNSLFKYKADISMKEEQLEVQLERLRQPAVIVKSKISELEDQVRKEAVAQHSQTGETKYDGVIVKHFETITITNEKDAKE